MSNLSHKPHAEKQNQTPRRLFSTIRNLGMLLQRLRRMEFPRVMQAQPEEKLHLPRHLVSHYLKNRRRLATGDQRKRAMIRG